MTRSNFDVIIVADFRFPGGTSSAVAAEIRALHEGGFSVALFQANSPILERTRQWNDIVLARVDAGQAAVLRPGEPAACDVLLAHSPWLFTRPQPEQPQIEAALRVLIAHHTPTDATGRLNYDPELVSGNACRAFGSPFYWAPISPVCRDSFETAGMTQPRLRFDWANVVFVDDWGHARPGLLGDPPVIGRHSRPQLDKWGASRAEVLAPYPEEMEVRLLGAGEKVRALIEPAPENWTVSDFGAMPVKDFLSGLDFFVYFHHPQWVETFGLTIAEAAAAGCVVVTHPYLERTFGKAALYCLPEEAPRLIGAIAEDSRQFAEQSALGRAVIDNRFGPKAYRDRFERLLAASRDPSLLNGIVSQPKRDAKLWLRGLGKRSAYWSRNGVSPKLQSVLQSKAVRRPVRKVKKALRLN